MRIFIGHDTRYEDASSVCRQSIIENSSPNEHKITYLHKEKLKNAGVYGRADVEGESTEFSFTRFYAPLTANFTGTIMFCDQDFVWLCNPSEILDTLDMSKPVHCVKHEINSDDIQTTKMNNQVNKVYPKKFWSSLIIWTDPTAFKHITKESLDGASAKALHQFQWVNPKQLGSIDKKYNYLVGYYNDNNYKALHYTQGGPWLPNYENCEHADKWHQVYSRIPKINQ
jgi:hypothetical protein|tara:strand:+ start:101 stop:781 length:681 start_codon:yes stop_codon:yes gene_type:complete